MLAAREPNTTICASLSHARAGESRRSKHMHGCRMQLAEYARIPPESMLKLPRSSACERVRAALYTSLRTMEAMRREIGFVFVQSMPRWSLRPRRGAPRVGGRHRTSRRYWIDVCAKACTCSCLQAECGGDRGHFGCSMVERRDGVAASAPGVPG